jgi:chromosome segregation ATPase
LPIEIAELEERLARARAELASLQARQPQYPVRREAVEGTIARLQERIEKCTNDSGRILRRVEQLEHTEIADPIAEANLRAFEESMNTTLDRIRQTLQGIQSS